MVVEFIVFNGETASVEVETCSISSRTNWARSRDPDLSIPGLRGLGDVSKDSGTFLPLNLDKCGMEMIDIDNFKVVSPVLVLAFHFSSPSVPFGWNFERRVKFKKSVSCYSKLCL